MKYTFTVSVYSEGMHYLAKCIENNMVEKGKSIDEALLNLKNSLESHYKENPERPTLQQNFITTLELVIQ